MHIPLSPLTLPWSAKQSRVPRSASPVVGFLSSNLLGITAKQRYWVGFHMMKTPKNSPITKKLSAELNQLSLDGMSHWLDKTCDWPTIFAVVIPMKMGLWQPQTLGQVPNGMAVTSVPNGNDTHTHKHKRRLAACGTQWKEWAPWWGVNMVSWGRNILWKKPSEIICLRLTWTSFLRKAGLWLSIRWPPRGARTVAVHLGPQVVTFLVADCGCVNKQRIYGNV